MLHFKKLYLNLKSFTERIRMYTWFQIVLFLQYLISLSTDLFTVGWQTCYQPSITIYHLPTACWFILIEMLSSSRRTSNLFFLLHQCLEYNVCYVRTRKCDMYNTVLWYIKSAGVTNIRGASQRRFLNKNTQGSRLFFGTGKWDSNRECSFTFERYVNNILRLFCVVYPSLRNAKHTAIFFPLLFDHTVRDKVLQKEWETTGKVSRTWKHGRASVVIGCKRENRRAVIHICRSARTEEEEDHAIHFTEERCRAGMQSHQGGLTFYCEDAGARRGASAVHGLAHVLSLVLWEGLWQVEAVRLSPLYILIVLTVLEHLPLKPPGHLRLGLPGDLNGEPHRLRVHHWLIFEGLLEPWSPRPGVILLIFVGCRAVNDATLVLHIVLLLLQTDERKFNLQLLPGSNQPRATLVRCSHALGMMLHLLYGHEHGRFYLLEGGINLLLLKLHPLQLLLLYPPPFLILSGFGHLFKSGFHIHLLFEWWLLGPRRSRFSFLILLWQKRNLYVTLKCFPPQGTRDFWRNLVCFPCRDQGLKV